MKIKYLIAALAFLIPGSAIAQTVWYPTGSPTTLRPAVSAWTVTVPQLGGNGVRCLQADNTGLLSVSASACSSSGGAGSGTVSTSTPLVSGQVDFSTGVNTIGNDSTFTFDSTGKLLSVTGLLVNASSTLQAFTFTAATGTSATTTSFFSTNASTTNLTGVNISGFGLSTCNGTSALTWVTNRFGCAAQPQGTVTSVSGTANRITSTGGAAPVIDISGSYVGQSSITTLGTISSGAVPASLVTSGTFGSGNYTFPTDVTVTGSATTTDIFASHNASSTNLYGVNVNGFGLSTCNSASNALIWVAGRFGCNSITGGSSTYDFPLAGNATSTLTQFNGGITAYASSTIGNKAGAGGLTIDGNATTTGTIYQSGRWAHFGTTSCGTGGVAAPNLLGIEVCGSDNNTGGGVQVIASNTNGGANAWTGIETINNLGDLTLTHYSGLFQNSSTYTDTSFGTAIAEKNLSYLQNSDGRLAFISSTSTTALNPAGIEFLTGGTTAGASDVGGNVRIVLDKEGRLGVGTTTPHRKSLVDFASSTVPQLTLTDPTDGVNHWSFRNAGGVLYVATSSPTTYATSTLAALSIDSNGQLTLPYYSGVGCAQFAVGGALSNTGSACNSGGGGGGGNSKWATSTIANAIYNNMLGNVGVGTTTPPSSLTVATTTFVNASKPIGILIGPNTLASGSAAGTIIGSNLASTFTGNFIDLQSANSSKFSVASDGSLTNKGNSTLGPGSNLFLSNNGFSINVANGGIGGDSGGRIDFSNSNGSFNDIGNNTIRNFNIEPTYAPASSQVRWTNFTSNPTFAPSGSAQSVGLWTNGEFRGDFGVVGQTYNSTQPATALLIDPYYHYSTSSTGSSTALYVNPTFTSVGANLTNYIANFAVASSSKMVIDSNGNVGIGTTTPNTILHISKGANATTTVSIGELGLSTSKACVNMQTSAGTQASFYINAGGAMVVELNQCK